MGDPTLEVGYTSATTGRGDYEDHKGHVVAVTKDFISDAAFSRNVTKCILSFSKEKRVVEL
jgi:hypothetical protein